MQATHNYAMLLVIFTVGLLLIFAIHIHCVEISLNGRLNTFLENLHWHFMFLNQHFTASYKPPDQHFRGRNAEMSVNVVLGKNQVAVE